MDPKAERSIIGTIAMSTVAFSHLYQAVIVCGLHLVGMYSRPYENLPAIVRWLALINPVIWYMGYPRMLFPGIYTSVFKTVTVCILLIATSILCTISCFRLANRDTNVAAGSLMIISTITLLTNFHWYWSFGPICFAYIGFVCVPLLLPLGSTYLSFMRPFRIPKNTL